jgi:chaperonin GroES
MAAVNALASAQLPQGQAVNNMPMYNGYRGEAGQATPAPSAVNTPIGPDREQVQKLIGWIKSPNIAEELDETVLSTMGERVKREFDIDDNSRSDWKTKTEQAMDLAMQNAKEKQFPWPKAANVIYPMVTTASTQFAARAYPAIVNGRSIVRGVVVGEDVGTPMLSPQNGQPVMQPGPPGPDGQPTPMPVWQVPPGGKRIKADQIGEHMSWQLLDEQPEWEPETDQLLHLLPIVGCVFRKTYFDPGKGRNCSLMVSPMNFVVNYHAKSLETTPRTTEIIQYYPLEIEEMERAGTFKKPKTPYGEAENADGDKDAPHEFLEQHRYWDLDEDGYAEPYIITIHKQSGQVVRVVARYDAEGIHFSKNTHRIAKIDPVFYYTKYDFIPNPDGGFYAVGFGQLLRPINESINTVLNQLLDAGTLANAGGGFIGKGLSMNAGAIRFSMGEYKTVNVPGGTLKENIVPMTFPGPSEVLFKLLGMLVEAGKEIAAVKDVLTGDQKASNVPATTTLALIEQGLKVFTAIYKRVHRALKQELAKLYRLNQVYGKEQFNYKVGDTWKQVLKQDYVNGSGVEPVSDPTMVSDMQRMGRAQFLLNYRMDPNVNGVEILKRAFAAADIDNIPALINEQPAPNPMLAIKGHELDLKDQEQQSKARLERATELERMSRSILNLAQADAAVAGIQGTAADQHLQWLGQNLQVWQTQFDAAANPATGPEGAPVAGGPKPPPPHMAHPATIPGPNGNIQPDISDTDNMTGSLPGVKDGPNGPREDPDSHYAADHGTPAPS